MPAQGPPQGQHQQQRAFQQGPPDKKQYPPNSIPLRDLQQQQPQPLHLQSNQFNNHHYGAGLDSDDEGLYAQPGFPNQRDTVYSLSSQQSLFHHQDSSNHDARPFANMSRNASRDPVIDKGKRRHGHPSESDSDNFSDSERVLSSGSLPGADIDLFGPFRGPDDGRYTGYSPSSAALLSLLEHKKSPLAGIQYRYDNSPPTPAPGSNDPQSQPPPDQYPAWTIAKGVPLTRQEIEGIMLDLTRKFGFQMDSMRNQYDAFMTMLDSRASRMSPIQALTTIHADYIGGENANYRKWYFAAQLDLDDHMGYHSAPLKNKKVNRNSMVPQPGAVNIETHDSLAMAEQHWKARMNQMSHFDRARQVALYLLLWGEASQIRFLPECLCFIYKCAEDYYLSPDCQRMVKPVPEGQYLRTVISPLYRFIRDQGYEVQGGRYVKRERDHDSVIGYDDINQAFWSPEGIERIHLRDKVRLIDVHIGRRWGALGHVDWDSSFRKTYIEKRTWLHLAVNFTRVWIIHVVAYWYYTAYNAPFLYMNDTTDQSGGVHWSVVGLGGAIATLIMLLGVFCEFMFIPLTWSNSAMLIQRLILLIIVLVLNVGPAIYVCLVNRTGSTSLYVGMGHFAVSLITTIVFAIVPSNQLFGGNSKTSRKNLASQTFTASFPKLKGSERALSIFLWALVFGCKLTESYFFLARSFKDPLMALYSERIPGCKDKYLGQTMCTIMPVMTLGIMFIVDLVLFFLDTYLWYVIWNTIFSVFHSFRLGISVWTPWRSVFSRLPKRMYAKLLATADMDIKYKPKLLCSQIWNAIIISMYREHILSIEHAQRMLFQQVPSENGNKLSLKTPTFFIAQEDSSIKAEFYTNRSEAERRINFFAQSLATPIPEPLPVDQMPTFTVLVPHYSEKTLLSLREIIREEDQNTRVTLLEYLKQLHPVEWDNFVRDTKIMAEESSLFNGASGFGLSAFDSDKENRAVDDNNNDDLPFYSIGFKSASPEFTLRTRIWASLRAQTLYRTVSGFMNYAKAIKLLYRIENPEVVQQFGGNGDRLERELDRLSQQKFKFVVSMQRYTKFSKDEAENAEFLLQTYPSLQIAYLDERPPEVEGEEPIVYSVLIDGKCEILPDGKRRPRFRIRLPGNPILGDGKSDNQNHAIVFTRGEYIQLIRNVLGEFEQYHAPSISPYSPQMSSADVPEPVAIVGAREYIFSENIGVLGDVAAGKEQVFGTLTQRMMAKIGGKLHYGHPDFLNFIYMTTRGGVSKAQKGLHLNEDIYAEQMLSREYYYLGTQLPLDRFLTFYYAHPGFHINNIFIMLSVQLFMFSMLFIGSMASSVEICADVAQAGCVNLVPVYDWIKRCVLSIFIVFFIAFLPLFLQEFMERGLIRSLVRLGKQFMSLSPLFEVFVTQIYTNSILTNLSFGGARYIATGRGFATTRTPFALLYSRFAGPSLYLGMRTLIMLIFASMTMWVPHLIYFWVSVIALVISPFIFNPHQFSFAEFFLDYREFLRWLSRGNSRTHVSSWISYCRTLRTRITGYKRKRLGHPSEKLGGDIPKANFWVIFVSEIVFPLIQVFMCVVCYMFVRSFPSVDNQGAPVYTSGLLRVGIFALAPLVVNAAVLAILFAISLLLGPCMNMCCVKFGSIMAAIAHGVAVLTLLGFFEALWALEAWNASHAVLGIIAAISVQRFVFKVLIAVFLTREFKHDETNRAWWTGKWHGRGLGSHAISQPLRDKQIRAPIFSAKLRAQRRQTVLGYGALFVVVMVVFVMLIVGPVVFSKWMPKNVGTMIPI
ncbi:1,3-beta-D-glucan synthase [Mortierella sp. AD032]|nr:1,3-beta-D-glucan synthase [Mortierella sp. AD032]